jgi:hypothetical protein
MPRRRGAKRPAPQPPRTRKQVANDRASGRWVLVLTIAVSAVGTAIVTVLGVGSLYRWALFLIALDLAAAISAVTYALTEPKHRILALWISNCLFFALLAGIAIYSVVGVSLMPAINVIPNRDIALSAEAGVSPAREPSGLNLYSGNGQTVDCYTTVGRTIWLYFYNDSADFGWAPLADFHYENGFSKELPSHC